MKKNILMIGIGLIGSSIALSIKETTKNTIIVGFSHDKEELIGAKSQQIIDEISFNLEKAAQEADVIFLCTPVSITLKLIQELSTFSLKESVIITDVGSTKVEIMNQAKVLLDRGYTFIGGHPMAGSHKSGFLAGNKDLFENAYYILVPAGNEMNEQIACLTNLLAGTRAKIMILEAHEHDRITGVLSHMPHIIAAQLVQQADDLMVQNPKSKKLAAGGFRDITRIASSDPKMWTDISKSNTVILEKEIDNWLVKLSDFKDILKSGNEVEIFNFFERSKRVRDEIPVHKEGTIPAFHDLYINVPDYPGAIAEVTEILAKANISLINIKIMETRDDIFGILRVSFKNEKDLFLAKETVAKYTSYESVIN
ncbi:prephenate dehydrogenase [Vagococcus carniphilus]|uniref:prephenate dehydrogenase n=1 Tax=Vagococcus carniphilus TaxID=218144 RepID=UPI00289069C9|nr:prephenate dehydrogenase [Vagococcus carniphilus]MDT2815518.1 prephenate dehydrogenase [Vagococcus carniphilus]MDT2829560.1 prephenate dehydrogenase [Vagococcus carniphilus]MDT2839019.1 prephenate dehydrogenase [Vagococcus carniphilus]MDT2847691.1 prephenate dehydrogenase [Vagococcus carniphilus]MDT2853077.1 prephenate dehydrogenase [Vagococcus carniphilus]